MCSNSSVVNLCCCVYRLPPNATPNKIKRPSNGLKPFWGRNFHLVNSTRMLSGMVLYCVSLSINWHQDLYLKSILLVDNSRWWKTSTSEYRCGSFTRVLRWRWDSPPVGFCFALFMIAADVFNARQAHKFRWQIDCRKIHGGVVVMRRGF